jgi:hypothetical protein
MSVRFSIAGIESLAKFAAKVDLVKLASQKEP